MLHVFSQVCDYLRPLVVVDKLPDKFLRLLCAQTLPCDGSHEVLTPFGSLVIPVSRVTPLAWEETPLQHLGLVVQVISLDNGTEGGYILAVASDVR